MMVESVRQCTECCCCCSLAITQQTASGKFYLPVPSEFQNRDHHTFPLSKTSSKHSQKQQQINHKTLLRARTSPIDVLEFPYQPTVDYEQTDSKNHCCH
ncbi:hypothetical protein T4C_2348 [Trichinella pseudospiralis]|uniref:Uncharacterized protein n=1 Tax=Trichinella pseudospiralis TaxID=6337 RepID=A0A0V1IYD8_TRIPS|nr:hypothetical protein T4C_2348 [Trichinella pseudospiralis]